MSKKDICSLTLVETNEVVGGLTDGGVNVPLLVQVVQGAPPVAPAPLEVDICPLGCHHATMVFLTIDIILGMVVVVFQLIWDQSIVKIFPDRSSTMVKECNNNLCKC